MTGLIANYYKMPLFPNIANKNNGDERSKDGDGYYTYGYYDRLVFDEVANYSKYIKLSEHSRQWDGRRQSILLYYLSGVGEKHRLIYDKDRQGFAAPRDYESTGYSDKEGAAIEEYVGKALRVQVRRVNSGGITGTYSNTLSFTIPARPAAQKAPNLNMVAGTITGVNARQQYIVVDAAKMPLVEIVAALNGIDFANPTKPEDPDIYRRADKAVIQGWTTTGGSAISPSADWYRAGATGVADPYVIVRVAPTDTAPAGLVAANSARSLLPLKPVRLVSSEPSTVNRSALVSELFNYNACNGALTTVGSRLVARTAALNYLYQTNKIKPDGTPWNGAGKYPGLAYTAANKAQISTTGTGNWENIPRDLRPWMLANGNTFYIRFQGRGATAPTEAIRITVKHSGDPTPGVPSRVTLNTTNPTETFYY